MRTRLSPGITLGRMEGAWFARVRWRRRGAWLWPTFTALTLADGVIGHELPPTGDKMTFVAAALLGGGFNLIGVILLRWPLGSLIRRVRGDLPWEVAKDYAGTAVVTLVSVVLLSWGLANRSSIIANENALHDAVVRAQAWIGDRAPSEFRAHVALISTLTIEAGRVYRSCVPSIDGRRAYCVIVRRRLPLASSVRFDGYEPNSVFAQGMQ
jgi:hypothetical protein